MGPVFGVAACAREDDRDAGEANWDSGELSVRNVPLTCEVVEALAFDGGRSSTHHNEGLRCSSRAAGKVGAGKDERKGEKGCAGRSALERALGLGAELEIAGEAFRGWE